MSDTQQFLDEMMPRIHKAETALHNGDAGPRFEMWSRTDPVTVFGAAFSPIGWTKVGAMFERIASRFELPLMRVGSGCRRRRRRLCISARDRTDDSVGRRLRTDAVHAPQHDDLPARERRVEDRASPCRSNRRLRSVARAVASQPMKAMAQIREPSLRIPTRSSTADATTSSAPSSPTRNDQEYRDSGERARS
jgi:hypothetical protein